MKKNYIAPAITVVEIEAENILAGSGEPTGTNMLEVENDFSDTEGTVSHNDIWGD